MMTLCPMMTPICFQKFRVGYITVYNIIRIIQLSVYLLRERKARNLFLANFAITKNGRHLLSSVFFFEIYKLKQGQKIIYYIYFTQIKSINHACQIFRLYRSAIISQYLNFSLNIVLLNVNFGGRYPFFGKAWSRTSQEFVKFVCRRHYHTSSNLDLRVNHKFPRTKDVSSTDTKFKSTSSVCS